MKYDHPIHEHLCLKKNDLEIDMDMYEINFEFYETDERLLPISSWLSINENTSGWSPGSGVGIDTW